MKIYKHEPQPQGGGKVNDSVGLQIKNKELVDKIETRIRNLARNSQKEIKKLDHKKLLHPEDLQLIKVDASGKDKIYAKLYCQNGKISAPFYSTEKEDDEKRIQIDPTELVGLPLLGKVILTFLQVFLGNISSIPVVVKAVLVKEILKPESIFHDFDDDE